MAEPVNLGTPLRRVPQNSFVKTTLLPGLTVLLIILAGAGTGWYLAGHKTGITKSGQVPSNSKDLAAPGAQVTSGGNEVGINDQATFRDTAEGTLEAGGKDGDGTHHLTRTGGDSQTVALTSSVVDLDQFVGKKVQVWGETNKGQKAAWLMDVGKVKVLE